MTQLLFWDRKVQNEIDSEILRGQLKDTQQYYTSIYQQLTQIDPQSPYREKNSISLDEFLWAFSTVSSRHLTLNNTAASQDQNPFLMIMPLLDFINHSFEPNVIVLPFEDRVNGESFMMVQAIRDISENEQLFVNYGNIGNTHLIQKYGFTLEDNPYNSISHTFPMGDFSRYIYEELTLKKTLA